MLKIGRVNEEKILHWNYIKTRKNYFKCLGIKKI